MGETDHYVKGIGPWKIETSGEGEAQTFLEFSRLGL